MIWTLLATATWAQDPEPAPTPDAAPAPAPAGPTLELMTGTWYVTAQVDGKEVVAWQCASNAPTFEFDAGFVMIGLGQDANGGKILSTETKGDTLVVHTAIAQCPANKDVTVRWADATHEIAEITRCVGTPRTVRAVHDEASKIPVMRECCMDTAAGTPGARVKYVGINDTCPSGSTGPKPTPLPRG